jgi:hypothetical protein
MIDDMPALLRRIAFKECDLPGSRRKPTFPFPRIAAPIQRIDDAIGGSVASALSTDQNTLQYSRPASYEVNAISRRIARQKRSMRQIHVTNIDQLPLIDDALREADRAPSKLGRPLVLLTTVIAR